MRNVVFLLLLSVFLFPACGPKGSKTLNMNRVKRIEFTSNRPDDEGCADPADESKKLPLGTKYCLNPTGEQGGGDLYVCKADGAWYKTSEKCP